MTHHLYERRAETWTVIEGQTVRIPRGSFHTIRAETLLKVMEIQTSEDIGVEDKIVWVKV